ncbi:stage III sporulation protein AG [Bacillus sp. FJAT-49736]|uniref:stage III sporulation protein AG n=1 Tax=Bacillus sp. FJAT-49736 TaxID=2833582 RepID=UPI001BCA1FDE|nr:stage III sporulation protein AG [Bacillus sp. FJAT-49736]MBS4173424.1 stage III sporulation protein AG [Bacillus sp. FJAT-49736]
MSDKKGPFDWLKEKLFASQENQSSGKKNKLQYFLILLLFGIAIMLISNIWSKNQNDNSTPVFNQPNDQKDVATFGSGSSNKQAKSMKDYERQYESVLKDALEQIDGVGKVKVVVNVGSSESKVYEKNTTSQNQTTTETDRNGGERKVDDLSQDEKLVIIRNGENETPIVTETKKPNIVGVLVIAEGANNMTIQRWVKEAVARTFNVPDYKVTVLPKKN